MIAGVWRSSGLEVDKGQARARDSLALRFDDLVDCRRADATVPPGRAGANDVVVVASTVADRFADRSIADAVALADDHRLLLVLGCVPKIVLIAIKPLCDRGLGKWDPSRDRKWLPPMRKSSRQAQSLGHNPVLEESAGL